MSNSPIGVFDSGFGGLTVLKEIITTLPDYHYIYLGDNARAPYGTRDAETVYQYTRQAILWFFENGCELVILACNTASALALRRFQQTELPLISATKRVLGVVRPTAEIIGNYSKNGHIGILGTTATIQSNSYIVEIQQFFPNLKISQEACPMWVPLIENNELNNAGAHFFYRKYCQQLLDKDPNIDAVLLACTHYPIIQKQLQSYLPNISIIGQGSIVAKSLDDYLQRHTNLQAQLIRRPIIEYFTTGKESDFEEKAALIVQQRVKCEKVSF